MCFDVAHMFAVSCVSEELGIILAPVVSCEHFQVPDLLSPHSDMFLRKSLATIIPMLFRCFEHASFNPKF